MPDDHPDLQPDEAELIGGIVVVDGKVASDRNSLRIDWLTKHRLVRITDDRSGWCSLFVDPRDGRLWESTYPHSEMHGGGPRALSLLSTDEATRRYGPFDLPASGSTSAA